MKKNEFNKLALTMLEKAIRVEVSRNDSVWPPLCTGILHQPNRPKKLKKIR
jgi:hypothetical protein